MTLLASALLGLHAAMALVVAAVRVRRGSDAVPRHYVSNIEY